MTTHATTSLDSHHPRHHALYNNRTYARTKTTTTTTTTMRSAALNRPLQTYLKATPQINVCENLLYDVAIAGDVGSATSSSYINSSEHYDNTYSNTYDNPIQYFERYPSKSVDSVKRSYTELPRSNENFYDRAKGDDEDADYSSNTSRSTSPVLFYLENRNLAICACIISLLLLLLIGLSIFLLNKFFRPVIINTTVNNHFGIMNMSNTTTTTTTTMTALPMRFSSSTPLMVLLKQASEEMLVTTTRTLLEDSPLPPFLCPSDRWGQRCEYVCKPCGLGVCHSGTGQCICPTDIYGEFCDLWKVNDKPKRGDMMS